MLIGLGFPPLEASALSLIANTAPVAFGALGTPVIALQGVTGLDLGSLSAMVGRQLPFFSVIVPFWLIAAYAGFRGMLEVWPALLVAGLSFAIPQFLVSNFHGPWLVDIVASACSMLALALFLRYWRHGRFERDVAGAAPLADGSASERRRAPRRAHAVDRSRRSSCSRGVRRRSRVFSTTFPHRTFRSPAWTRWSLASRRSCRRPTHEPAVFALNWLSATGTAILLAAIIAGFALRYSVTDLVRRYVTTFRVVWRSLLTIAAMLALGYTTRYSGEDAILGLAFAHTGAPYPFFAAMLGWLGVALTGCDTSSNVLFGSLQKITATRLSLDPVLMAAANSSGGVMGKMIDAQSIVVASTATGWTGHEWRILRFVFFHSLALASLVGILVLLQQYVFTGMLVR